MECGGGAGEVVQRGTRGRRAEQVEEIGEAGRPVHPEISEVHLCVSSAGQSWLEIGLLAEPSDEVGEFADNASISPSTSVPSCSSGASPVSSIVVSLVEHTLWGHRRVTVSVAVMS